MTSVEEYIHRVIDLIPAATPLRSQIAMELRGHIAERVAAGHSADDALRQLGDPTVLAESYLQAVPLRSASFWRRAVAKMVDAITVVVVVAPLVWIAWRSESGEWFSLSLLLAILGGTLLFSVYTIVSEYRIGQTCGKRALGIRVVRESGAQISLGQSVVRQFPMFLQIYLIDVLFALFTERKQRAFELLSKTRVVAATPREA